MTQWGRPTYLGHWTKLCCGTPLCSTCYLPPSAWQSPLPDFDSDCHSCSRLAKRIYVPLPDAEARLALLRHLLKDVLRREEQEETSLLQRAKSSATRSSAALTMSQLRHVVNLTEGYSGSDLAAVRTFFVTFCISIY